MGIEKNDQYIDDGSKGSRAGNTHFPAQVASLVLGKLMAAMESQQLMMLPKSSLTLSRKLVQGC